ncbi:ferrochelatase [Scopulibacillus darangshiensis]|uniref:Coproporphyrin III ferrochelatase n=1 Tax=Scopulibacillus darangshiensis TaxID=442528 RepID=A0A4R2P3K2_9BACL|nr:ferrochelatase [Scopulibacillus darangshiensis]TCP29262.1 ferrochelatase [Scopulibacillus darangshiensis]
MAKKKIGLLVMAYGTPYSSEDIEPYYTHIRHGRRPTDDLLQDLKGRYEAIGGTSPLAKITKEQAEGLEKRLNERQNDVEFKAYLGLKHIHPFIEDAVKQMHEDGIDEAVSLVLAPHFSTFSVKAYNERAIQTAKELGGPSITSVESWYREPAFISYWADQIRHTFKAIPEKDHEQTVVVFSAHSLPEKIISTGDPYPNQLEETAKLISEAANLQHDAIGWQSAGNTPDPWIGPDVQDLTRDLYEQEGYRSFIYCPVGFVAEHLEVLYDNDFECKVITDELGAAYYRPDMPNANPEFIDCLTNVVLKTLSEKSGKVNG